MKIQILRIPVIAVVCAWVVPFSANAADFYVDTVRGSDLADGMSWSTARQTIGGALSLDPIPGDTVHIAQGVYAEAVVLLPGIVVLGGYPTGGGDRDPGVFTTAIDGMNTVGCVTGADDAVLDGVTLQNGCARSGGGVIHSGITMQVSNCIIRDCTATGGNPYGGGAMYFYLSDSTVSNCLFENNRQALDPDSGSGEAMGGAIMSWAARPVIVNCIFRENRVTETPKTELRMGGAFWASASAPVIRRCLFENNTALSGGAIGWWNRSTPLVEACTFLNNRAESLGGAICHIYNEKDSAENLLWIRDSLFDGNSAETGGAVMVARNNRVAVSNCLMIGNNASVNGSGIAVENRSECIIDHSTLAHNTVTAGGSSGGCITMDGSSSITVTHSIVAFNTGLHGIELQPGGDPLAHHIGYSDVYGHVLNYSLNLVDRTGWQGNIASDPLFIDTGSGGLYRLSEPDTGDPEQTAAGRSPCIDTAGHPAPGYPQARQTTRTDDALDTGIADMGFHQWSPGTRLIADVPYAGQSSVDTLSPVTCRLTHLSGGIAPADIAVAFDDTPVDFEVEVRMDGYGIDLVLPGEMSDDTEHSVSVIVDSDPDTERHEFVFSTGEPPPEPGPPEGSCPELWFPMKNASYSAGDNLSIVLMLYDPWLNPVHADIHVFFEYAGDFFIYPAWGQEIHPVNVTIQPGCIQTLEVLSLVVPEGIPACGPFRFYGIGTRPGTYAVSGDPALWTMYFTGS